MDGRLVSKTMPPITISSRMKWTCKHVSQRSPLLALSPLLSQTISIIPCRGGRSNQVHTHFQNLKIKSETTADMKRRNMFMKLEEVICEMHTFIQSLYKHLNEIKYSQFTFRGIHTEYLGIVSRWHIYGT